MRPDARKQRDFLLLAYFGVHKVEFAGFVSRAYRDWNRTLRGIGRIDKKKKEPIFAGAKTCLTEAFEGLRLTPHSNVSGEACVVFDHWHDRSCEALVEHYREALRDLCDLRMTYGQAQKWLNMTIKYCWLFGGQELDWLRPWYPVAHVPVDEVILKAAKKEDVVAEQPRVRWSRWTDGVGYQNLQRRIRREAARLKISPLELEYRWWNKYH